MARTPIDGVKRLFVGGHCVANAGQDAESHEYRQQSIALVLFGRVINNAHQALTRGSQFAHFNSVRPPDTRFILRPLFRVADKWSFKANAQNLRSSLIRLALSDPDNTLDLLARFLLPVRGDGGEKRGHTELWKFAGNCRDIFLRTGGDIVTTQTMNMDIDIAGSHAPRPQIAYLDCPLWHMLGTQLPGLRLIRYSPERADGRSFQNDSKWSRALLRRIELFGYQNVQRLCCWITCICAHTTLVFLF